MIKEFVGNINSLSRVDLVFLLLVQLLYWFHLGKEWHWTHAAIIGGNFIFGELSGMAWIIHLCLFTLKWFLFKFCGSMVVVYLIDGAICSKVACLHLIIQEKFDLCSQSSCWGSFQKDCWSGQADRYTEGCKSKRSKYTVLSRCNAIFFFLFHFILGKMSLLKLVSINLVRLQIILMLWGLFWEHCSVYVSKE